MTVTITFDPNVEVDTMNAQLFFERVVARLRDEVASPSGNSDTATQIADDLLGRLGERGSELLEVVSQFDEDFSLPDIAAQTGDTIPQIRSRWANLGRSLAATRARFGNAEIFKEQMPVADGDGYWRFVMNEGIRDAVRQRMAARA